MNHSNYYISLDIRDSRGACCPDMKQGDTLRRLYIHLTDGGRPYSVSADCFPVFTAKKPDGTVILNPCRVENEAIVYEITPQTTACTGLLQCEVRLYDHDPATGSANLLTSARFGIRVHPTVYNEGDIPASSDEVGALTKLIGEAQQATEAAEAAAAAVPGLIDDTVTSTEKAWSGLKINNEIVRSIARNVGYIFYGEGAPTAPTPGGVGRLYMDTQTGWIYKCTAWDANAGCTWEVLDGKKDMEATTLRVGADVVNDVVVQTKPRENDAQGEYSGVLHFSQYGYPDKKVIFRNIAPGTADNDAVTVVQLQDAINGIDLDGNFEGKDVLCKSVTLMDDAGNFVGMTPIFEKDVSVLDLVGTDKSGDGTTAVIIRNVAAGRGPDDAVSFIQLMGVEDRVNINAQDIADLNNSIGDIETALDSIIAIQNELMGIEETVSFKVWDIDYTAPRGMTWGEIAEAGLLSYQCYDCQRVNNTICIEDGIVCYNACVYCDGAAYPIYDMEQEEQNDILPTDCPLDGHVYG